MPCSRLRHRVLAATLLSTAMGSVTPLPSQAMSPSPAQIRLSAPITRWDDGLPLGNGTIGALVWGSDSTIMISLDRGDLWDERRPSIVTDSAWTWRTMQRLVATDSMARFHQLFDEPYDNTPFPTKLPGGRLVLTWPGRMIDSFVLDLQRAEVRVQAGKEVMRIAVLRTPSLIVIDGPGTVRFAYLPPPGLSRLDPLGTPHTVTTADASGQIITERVAIPTATDTFSVETTRIGRVGETILLTQILADVEAAPSSDLATLASTITSSSVEAALAPHRAWWNDFWQGASVTIPDSALQTHYTFARYLYGAAARRGGAPIALQGLWTADNGGLPPWKGDYHNDLNTEMTYLAAHTTGADEAMNGWLDYLEARLPLFEEFGHSFYGVDGAVIPGVMSLAGHPLGGWGMYSLSPTNGAWVAWSFWKEWRMSRDTTFLRQRAWPFVRAVGGGLDELLRSDSHGRLVLPLSSSPEIGDNRREAFVSPNSNYDQALLRWIFSALFEMAMEMGDGTEAGYWRVRGEQLGPLATRGDTGALMVAPDQGFDSSHRHFSHALAIHPLALSLDSATVTATLDEIIAHGTSQWTGYSFAWFAAMLAHAGRGEEALRYLTDYLAFTGRNGFHLNGDQSGRGLSDLTYRPFTLEGNFLAMDAVHEMLLRSDGSLLEVFPATPRAWKDVSFDRLRADGGWIVTARREQGRTTQVVVEARVDALLRLRDPFEGRAVTWQGASMTREGPEWIGVVRRGNRVVGRVTTSETN